MMSCSARTLLGDGRYSAASCVLTRGSFIPKRLNRIEARGTPRWIDCREDGQGQRHGDDGDDIACFHLCRNLAQEINLRRKQIGSGEPHESLTDRLDV